uniref:Translation initiation factor eIF2B subunit epsilon n=1 Tax=Panagrellus redivivus TaxID=6233 RepID=A0A7E4WC13_PANRE
MTGKKEDNFTIVLIADNFDPHFAPVTSTTPWGKWHLADIQLLDLALDWISLINAPNVPNILIVSATLTAADLAEFERRWAFNFQSFRGIHCEGCENVGSIMREILARRLLPENSEFLLIENLATFCSSGLVQQIERFRNGRKKDKSCVMSMMYSRQISGEPRFVGFETESHKLLTYQGSKDSPVNEYDAEMFTVGSTIRSDLAPCGIVICSAEVLLAFSDNYDFETFDQVVSEFLVNADVLQQTIHVDILPEDVVAFTATDYGSLLRAQRLLVHRWCYPLTYDKLPARVFPEQIPLRYHRNHVYVPRDEEGPSNAEGTVLGKWSSIAESAVLVDVTLGRGACIGPGVKLRSVIAGDDFVVGDGCTIDGAVIGDNVEIGAGCKIGAKTVIGPNVKIPPGTKITSNSVVMDSHAPADENDIESTLENGYYLWKLLDEPSGYFWRRSQSFSRARRERHASSHSRSSLQHSISMESPDQAPHDVILDTDGAFAHFFSEIKDILNNTFESENLDNADVINKLKIEINGSKITNNISQEDVARGVFAAFLTLPPFSDRHVSAVQSVIAQFKQIWLNYYAPRGQQLQLLRALEEAALERDGVRNLMPHILLQLYQVADDDIDLEGAINEWHDELPADSVLRPLLEGFIDWLNQDDESSEEEEDA